MRLLTSFGAIEAACFLPAVLAARVPNVRSPWVATQAVQDLEPLLAPNTTFYIPEDADWANATERYNILAQPQVLLVVRPGVESDVSSIVQYANRNNIDFYASNRGHSLTISSDGFSGIQIDLRGLANIDIHRNTSTARFQAGVYGYQVLNTMAAEGYVAATGTCSCVGILGPTLGGGHGNQQGAHGLLSDALVNMNVVLANGTALTVSESSHSDLWWAMRGAGHNFGIVTSFEAYIYPDDNTYYHRTYTFTGDQLEPLFARLNEFHNGETLSTDWLGNWGVFTMDPTVSETEAVIVWVFVYAGPQEEAEPLFAPFDELEHIALVDGNIPYHEVNDVMGGGVDSPLCEPNRTHIIGTAGLQVYNVTAERQIYNLFNSKVAQAPSLASTRVLHEGYAVEGVLSFSADDSAFPFRDDYLLMYFDAVPPVGSNLTDFARQWQLETIDLFNAGQPDRLPTAYVNYASGYEPLEAMYGYEPWRLERLRNLKATYDPTNRFAYYNPIIPPTGN